MLSVFLPRRISTKATIEDILIGLKDLPGSIAMMSIGINDCKSLYSGSFPKLSNGNGSSIKVTSSTKKIGSSMMIAITCEDKSIVNLSRIYLFSRSHCAGS